MPDNPRIEDLRRRVQKDPASIAFAQLAEEYRRAGQYRESVDACCAGLVINPTYLSARVTLGRSLIELGELDQAQCELETVLSTARTDAMPDQGAAGTTTAGREHDLLVLAALQQWLDAINVTRAQRAS